LNFVPAQAAEYRLNNGDVLKGEAASFNDDGLVVRLDLGGFSPRVPWGKLTQETLKQLQQLPPAAEFVEPYIEIPPEVKEKEREKKKIVKVAEPPRVSRAEGRTSFFGALANPLGWTLLGILYLANLYAGMEVARWRGKSLPLVLAVSAVAPIIGPSLFAALPTTQPLSDQGVAEEAAPPADGVNPMQQALPSGMQGSGLGLAAAGQAGAKGGNPVYSQVYNRSNSTFDRRFFETKFTGFFRVVPSDAEKDLVMSIKTPKQEVLGVRVSRISSNEIHFQTKQGAEVSVPFAEITEVSVKPKGAK
ncbi:MAG TPA: hypothetical protein VK633_07275, partial [Verrucomicrobiae bacterium]|nr:hypothetical protein [Verrucomicrobiae bacterium]